MFLDGAKLLLELERCSAKKALAAQAWEPDFRPLQFHTHRKNWTNHMHTVNFSTGESSQRQEDQKLKQGMFYYNMTKELFPF